MFYDETENFKTDPYMQVFFLDQNNEVFFSTDYVQEMYIPYRKKLFLSQKSFNPTVT